MAARLAYSVSMDTTERRLVLSFVGKARDFKAWRIWNSRFPHVRTMAAITGAHYKEEPLRCQTAMGFGGCGQPERLAVWRCCDRVMCLACAIAHNLSHEPGDRPVVDTAVRQD